jgi:hypothetical protein
VSISTKLFVDQICHLSDPTNRKYIHNVYKQCNSLLEPCLSECTTLFCT